jgi:peptidoglycan LD-endopeptidase CwlK
MSRRLDDLAPHFRPLAVEFLARCVEEGLHVLIVDTRRTPAEQEIYLKRGVSWTRQSKHLTGEAIDVCPYAVWNLHGPDKLQWDAGDPVWQRLGALGESLGLVWGGRWTTLRDMGHFELPASREREARSA